MLGSLGLLMFVYGIGMQYGKEFFSGFTSPFGLKANALALLSHPAAVGVCYLAYTVFSVSPAYTVELFSGGLTSTPALHAAIGAAGNNDPALGSSVADPFGIIGPIICIYFAKVLLKPELPAAMGTGLELQEVVVRSSCAIGTPLARVTAALPAGVRGVLVREGEQNRVPGPGLILAQNGVVALACESAEALETARTLIGESAPGRIILRNFGLTPFLAGCGAVQAALETKVQDTRHRSRTQLLVDGLPPAISNPDPGLPPLRLAQAVESKVRWTVRKLLQTPEGRTRLAEGRMKISGAIYEIETGRVRFLNVTESTAPRAHA